MPAACDVCQCIYPYAEGLINSRWLPGMAACIEEHGDTTISATSRERCEKKLCLRLGYCHKSGIVINEDKAEFMVINGTAQDGQDLSGWDNTSGTGIT